MTVFESIEKALRPGEKILWQGRPSSAVRLQAFDRACLWMEGSAVLLLGGAAYYKIASALGDFSLIGDAVQTLSPSDRALVVGLMLVPLLVILLLLGFEFIGRFFLEAKMRAGMGYVLTDQRVLVAAGLFAPVVHALELADIPELTVFEEAEGCGSIAFRKVGSRNALITGPYSILGYLPFRPGFAMIPQVRKVEALFREAQKNAPTEGMKDNKSEYASFWSRTGAFLLDLAVASIGVGILFSFFSQVYPLPEGGGEANADDSLLSLVQMLCVVLYFAWQESSSWQTTLGKHLFGLKIVRIDGAPVGFGRALGRCFIALNIAIGAFSIPFVSTRQALYDMMLDTVVVRKRSK